MSFANYIKSERFIWDELLRRGEVLHTQLKELWGLKKRLPILIVAWPASYIKDDDGKTINDKVVLQLPAGSRVHQPLRKITQRTKAYALMMAEVTDGHLVVQMESHHGSRVWRTPIKRQDVLVLGKTQVKDDAPAIGVLWKPSRPSA